MSVCQDCVIVQKLQSMEDLQSSLGGKVMCAECKVKCERSLSLSPVSNKSACMHTHTHKHAHAQVCMHACASTHMRALTYKHAFILLCENIMKTDADVSFRLLDIYKNRTHAHSCISLYVCSFLQITQGTGEMERERKKRDRQTDTDRELALVSTFFWLNYKSYKYL